MKAKSYKIKKNMPCVSARISASGEITLSGWAKKYVCYTCYKNGFLVEESDSPIKGSLVYINDVTNPSQQLPPRIRTAYDCKKKGSKWKYKISNHALFFETDAMTDVPQELPNISYLDQVKADIRDMKKTEKEMDCSTYVTLPEGYDGDLVVSVHAGDVAHIRIRKAKASDYGKIPTLESFLNEFGHNWQHFSGEAVTYIYPANRYRRFSLPKFFRLRTGLSYQGAPYALYEGKTSLVIGESEKKCFIDDEPIIPAAEPVEEKTICNSCLEEEDQVTDIFMMLKELIPAVKELVDVYKKRGEEGIQLANELTTFLKG